MGERKLRKREEIPAEYKWNMQDMFATDELWEEEAQKVVELAKGLAQYNGHLSDSADTLYEFLQKLDEISYYGERVYVKHSSLWRLLHWQADSLPLPT